MRLPAALCLLFIFLSITPVLQATPIVDFIPDTTIATGIHNIEIEQAFWDVDFVAGIYSDVFADEAPAFLGDLNSAAAASVSIELALNAAHATDLPLLNLHRTSLLFPWADPSQNPVLPVVFSEQIGPTFLNLRDFTFDYGKADAMDVFLWAVITPTAATVSVSAIQSVPEPNAMLLLGIGLAGVAAVRKRFAAVTH